MAGGRAVAADLSKGILPADLLITLGARSLIGTTPAR